MDIKSRLPYPANELSNFYPHEFNFRGVKCASMEGLLQSLKFENTKEQIAVCLMVGGEAKDKGLDKEWRKSQTLWWQGEPIKRDNPIYQELLNEAFDCLFSQNISAKKALKSTNGEKLEHSIGVQDIKETVLTEDEFCSRLTLLYSKI